MTPMEWILKGEIGISSKTIWSVMCGVEFIEGSRCGFNFDVPQDPDDFKRCHKLLQEIPEWRDRLDEVAFVFPKWKPMVDNWERMTELYLEEIPDGNGRAPKLYALMKELIEKGMHLDGWTKTSATGWERKPGAIGETQ